MYEKQSLTVDESIIEDARGRWNNHLSRAGNKLTVSFDEMLSHFTECISYAEIAQKLDVSRERIRQIFEKYFRVILVGNSSRNKQIQEKAASSIKEKEWKLFTRKPFSSILRSAVLAGAEVLPIWSSEGKSIILKQIMINDHLCLVKTMSNSFRPNCCKRYYVHASIRTSKKRKAEFIIFHYEIENFPERIFVVPIAIFEDIILKSKNKTRVELYIPTERYPSYNKTPSPVDWWKYENAWQLIV